MTTEERWEFLLSSAKRVLAAFRGGYNPTEDNLHKLECAIDSVELQRICGHRLIEECDCEALDPKPFLDAARAMEAK